MGNFFEDGWWPMMSNSPDGVYLTKCPPYIKPARMTWNPEKQTATIHLTDMHLAAVEGFERLGHYEEIIPDDDASAKHKRAQELLGELLANEYFEWGDEDFWIKPIETQRWVFDETFEEWLQRWRDSKS